MSIEIKVPVLPESVSDATIAEWHKQPGDPVKRDDHLVDIETDKVVLEVVAPADGTLDTILKQQGDTVKAQETIALFKEGAVAASAPKTPSATVSTPAVSAPTAPTIPAPAAPTVPAAATPASAAKSKAATPKTKETAETLSPAARRRTAEQTVDHSQTQSQTQVQAQSQGQAQSTKATRAPAPMFADMVAEPGARLEKRVPMTRLRARIAERLVEAQHTAAILTTFNEVNMAPVIELRKKYKDIFEKTYGVRLGFMSFFTLAVIEALKHFPVVNASVDGNDIVYHGYYDIGIAVSSPRGLVVPVLKNAEMMSMDEIERQIASLAKKAETGQLSMEEITGGTFTITNGGVFGSLMATPILNPPQSGILGMHKIEERPVVEKGEIVIRPMMYVALSYDHRIIDGAESVRFLVTVKELLEDPARLALGI